MSQRPTLIETIIVMYYVLQLLDELEDKRRCSLLMAKELIVAAFGRPMPDPGKLVHVRTLV